MKRYKGHFGCPIHLEDDNTMYMFIVFPDILQPIKQINDIEFCGVLVDTLPHLIECNVYTGDQIEVDKMLLEHMPHWTIGHVVSGIPYIAMRVMYDDAVFGGCSGLSVFASIG